MKVKMINLWMVIACIAAVTTFVYAGEINSDAIDYVRFGSETMRFGITPYIPSSDWHSSEVATPEVIRLGKGMMQCGITAYIPSSNLTKPLVGQNAIAVDMNSFGIPVSPVIFSSDDGQTETAQRIDIDRVGIARK